MNVQAIYDGSDGEATKALFARLATFAAIGEVAINLFRASKSSGRAKVYRGGVRGQGSYRGMAYERKQWSMDNLCRVLTTHASDVSVTWGWKEDPAAAYHRWVLYVDLPTGQVSFHTSARGAGPDYGGEWDGVLGVSADRIVRWCEAILRGSIERPPPPAQTDAAPRWLWCRHCRCFWANRKTCPVHLQTALEVKSQPPSLLEIRDGVLAEWDEPQQV